MTHLDDLPYMHFTLEAPNMHRTPTSPASRSSPTTCRPRSRRALKSAHIYDVHGKEEVREADAVVLVTARRSNEASLAEGRRRHGEDPGRGINPFRTATARRRA
jgi:hypothetical protein